MTVDPRVGLFADRYAVDLVELGWTSPGGVEREIRRRLLEGEPLCWLNHPTSTRVALRFAHEGLSYSGISRVMTSLFGEGQTRTSGGWQRRLRRHGAPPRKPRGVPFGADHPPKAPTC